MITKHKMFNNTIWYKSDNIESFKTRGTVITELKVGDFIAHVGNGTIYVVTKIWNNPKFVGSPLCTKARLYKGINQNTKFEVIRNSVELLNYMKIEKAI